MMPKVSVVINCLNGAAYLQEALDSVFKQTFSDWEIVFWDNASVDESAMIAKRYGRKVRYFRSDKTYTLGKVRNLAFSKAQGEYIAMLDCDDVWLPKKLEKQLPLFERNANVGMTVTDSVMFDEHGDRYRYFQFTKPRRGMIFGPLLEDNFISTETMMLRRSFYESLNNHFDEDFTMVMDYDLSLRMAYEYATDYIDEPLSKFRVHENSQSRRKEDLIGKENERLLAKLKKHHPEIETCYGRELRKFEDRICYQRAMSEWKSGNVEAARRYLKKHLDDKNFFTLYIATFAMPYWTLNYGKKMVRYAIGKMTS